MHKYEDKLIDDTISITYKNDVWRMIMMHCNA